MGGTGEATDQDLLAPYCSPIHLRLLGEVGLNIALGLVTSCCVHQTAWLAEVRLNAHRRPKRLCQQVSGQYYKRSTIIFYESTVILHWWHHNYEIALLKTYFFQATTAQCFTKIFFKKQNMNFSQDLNPSLSIVTANPNIPMSKVFTSFKQF